MKRIIIILIGITMSCSISFAVAPPIAVQKAFEQKFPKATKVSWGKENRKEWEAEFSLGGNKISANFANDGTWLETERTIAVSELPKAVSESINKAYPAWKITETEKTESLSKGIIYEAEIKSGLHKKEISLKEDGTLIKE